MSTNTTDETLQALRTLERAKQERKNAEAQDPILGAILLEDITAREQQAHAQLQVATIPPQGPAGEFATPGPQKSLGAVVSQEKPDAITLQASEERLELVAKTGSYALALDLAQDLKARNSREKMLAHGAGVLYARSLRLITEAEGQTQTLERIRLINAADRLFRTAMDALLAFDKVRNGGTQKVQVRHVHVHPGGQAIVGNVTQGGRKRRGIPRGRRSKT